MCSLTLEERSDRQSRLCRVFGNPVAFSIAQLLLENGAIIFPPHGFNVERCAKRDCPSEIGRAASGGVYRG
jgi:hypothetical protein